MVWEGCQTTGGGDVVVWEGCRTIGGVGRDAEPLVVWEGTLNQRPSHATSGSVFTSGSASLVTSSALVSLVGRHGYGHKAEFSL